MKTMKKLMKLSNSVCQVRINGKPQGGGCNDWALSKLNADQTLPDGLLTHSGFVCHSGGICIIKYPDDSLFDCFTGNHGQVVERRRRGNQDCVHLITNCLTTQTLSNL